MFTMHKFYCRRCEIFIYADNLELLANRLNYHNEVKHPNLFRFYIPETIIRSDDYSTTDGMPPSYVGHASPRLRLNAAAPELTSDDRALLAGMKIRWDG